MNDLKIWLQKESSRQDKLLFLLASFGDPCSLSDLRDRSSDAGFKIPKKWNMSGILGQSKGKAIKTTKGWELTDLGKSHLKSLGITGISHAAIQVANDLRNFLEKLEDTQTKAFVSEAISCHESQLYRSAVVMSWLGAMDTMHKYVHQKHLNAFNKEADRVLGTKWKPAKSTDDLGRMKESDFLDRIESLSIIGKNAKTELKKCLDLRNACGHPNSYQISANQSAAHLENLLLNVFQKFSNNLECKALNENSKAV